MPLPLMSRRAALKAACMKQGCHGTIDTLAQFPCRCQTPASPAPAPPPWPPTPAPDVSQREASEAAAAQLHSERGELLRERTNLQHQLEFAAGCQAAAEAAAAAAAAALAERAGELERSQREGGDKDARLAQLEGEKLMWFVGVGVGVGGVRIWV